METTHITFRSPSEILVHGDSRLKEWRESLEFPVPGHEYTPRFKAGTWDGFYRPGKWLRPRGGDSWEFLGSRGLLPRITKAVPGIILPPEYLKVSLDQFEFDEIQRFPTLRDYQRKALLKIFLYRWGRIALATNAGKGAIIGIVAGFLSRRGHRVLILCDEIAVFQALRNEIEQWGGFSPALVESGTWEIPGDSISLVMVQTLSRRLSGEDSDLWRDWVQGMSVLLLDEADKATSKTWRGILRTTAHSIYRVGFSGTFPEDPYGDLLMDELMGPVLVREKNVDLVERGISAKPQVALCSYDAYPAVEERAIPWKEWKEMSGPERRLWIYDRAIVMNEERHSFIRSLVQPGVPTCIIVNRVDHGRALAEAIQGAVFLSGSSSKAKREKVLEAFAEGDFHILIATKILDRGTNRLGHAVDLIFASGEGSLRQSLQRIGRGLRRTGGKEFLRLVDIIDRGHHYLHAAGRKRVSLYQSEGFDVEVVRDI